MAARLQGKLRNPRQAKKIPRVECPEDPGRRRAFLAAVFPGTKLYDSKEEAADLVVRKEVDVIEEATQSQHHDEGALRRVSTRRRKPSARAIDIGESRSKCTDTTGTRPPSAAEAGQRQSVWIEATGISSFSHSKCSAAPPQSPHQRSDDDKLNTAVPLMASVTPSSLKRKRRVEPSRTGSSEGKKLARLLPTAASSVVTLQVPSKSLCGTRKGLDSASP
jgi:hypothetical protein